jgi:ADP-ribosylglycohydrolase
VITVPTPGAIRGGIFGHLLGDAAGVPYEFKPASALAPWTDAIDMAPPRDFPRAHGVPVGTWSDDGALMLCLLESLVEAGAFDPVDQMCRAVRWLTEGHLAVDHHVFDVGNTTSVALRRGARLLDEGQSPVQAGERHEHSQGNGSLMRILPLALWHRGTPDELVERAMIQSCLTHAHPTCRICCAIYCLWARNILDGVDGPFEAAFADVEALHGGSPDFRPVFETLRDWSTRRPGGSGYVVDTLLSAKWAVETGRDFKDVVKRSILLGNDTDTTAAVAGGIAGLQAGAAGLPADWLGLLRGKEWVDPLVAGLVG